MADTGNITSTDNGITKIYYFPLKFSIWERDDEYGSYNDYPSDYSGSEALRHKDEIAALINRENLRFDTPGMLAEYLPNGTLREKVRSMLPAIEERGGSLWGTMVMEVSGALTQDEVADLKDYIIGQNSDGFGVSLEQREITVPAGELCVHFWNLSDDYAVYTQQEFSAVIVQTQSGTPAVQERFKPEAPIIGADGNIYNILGIASSALKRTGLRDEAKEMFERVRESGSYDNALMIVMEYIEPVSVDEYQEPSTMDMSM